MLNKYQKVYRNLAVIEIRLLRSPHPNTVCFFASKNVSGGHGLSQWCNQDSFDSSSTRIRIFVKTDIFSSHLQDPETMPFVILAIYICMYIYIYTPNWQISLASFCCSDIFTPFSKKYVSILNVLKLFSPILKKRKNERQPRYDVWHHRSSTCTKRQSSVFKNLRFWCPKTPFAWGR